MKEKVYSRRTTKLIPLFQPEHESCRQNGPDCGQVQDWCPNKIIVVVHIFLLFFKKSGCCVVLTEMKAIIVSDSSNFSKRCCQCMFSEKFKGRQTDHVGIRNVPSDACYDDTAEKQGRCKL